MTLERAHPITSFVFFALAFLVAAFSEDPVIRFILLCSFCLYSFLLTGARRGLSDVCFYFLLLLMVSLVNPMFSHNGKTPLFFLNGNPVTLEAVLYGVSIGVSVIGMMYICKCLSYVMSEDKIYFLIGRASPTFALMLSMTLRFVPLFKERFKKTSDAQKTLGIYSSDSKTDRLRLAVSTFTGVVSQSLERSVEVSSSMKARGYASGKRTFYARFVFSPSDTILLVTVCVLALPLVALMLCGVLQFDFYPEITHLRFDAVRIYAYTSAALFGLLPSLLEIKENIKWKYLISKI